MQIDEIEALKRAIDTARSRNWEWRDHFWIDVEGDNWIVQAEANGYVLVDRNTGNIATSAEPGLDATSAFTIAKAYAIGKGLKWKPSFHLMRDNAGWQVGACQSQFGGQLDIHVDDSGIVTRHTVNPK